MGFGSLCFGKTAGWLVAGASLNVYESHPWVGCSKGCGPNPHKKIRHPVDVRIG
jgi:hypothetical protein